MELFHVVGLLFFTLRCFWCFKPVIQKDKAGSPRIIASSDMTTLVDSTWHLLRERLQYLKSEFPLGVRFLRYCFC